MNFENTETNTVDNDIQPLSQQRTDFRELEPANSICFSAITSAGVIGLSISSRRFDCKTLPPLRSRLELSRIESVVRKLEDWLGESLDFEPGKTGTESPPVLKIKIFGKMPVIVNVYVPVGCWQMVEGNSAEFDANGLMVEWSEFYAKFVLASFNLPEEELDNITQNATVLLPQSFESKWSPRLSIGAFGCYVDGTIEGPSLNWVTDSCFSLSADVDTDRSMDEDASEEIVSYCLISAKLFFNGQQMKLSEMVTNRLREHGGVLQCAGSLKATGTLIPIGLGMGLHINRVTTLE